MEFVEIPGNPVPDHAVCEALSAPGGAVLRAAYFGQTGGAGEGAPDRGCVVLLPGRVEFIEKYFEVVRELQARGFSVATLDWRGQGLSARMLPEPTKGHIDSFQTYEQDLRYFIERFVRPRASPPYLLLCHSMGGAIGLQTLLNGLPQVSAAVLCAPMTRILPNPFVRAIAWMASEAACAFGQAAASAPAGGPRTDDPPPGAAPDDPMTHDAARSQRFTELVAAAPGARLGRPTFGWLRAAFRASWSAMRPASLRRLTTPMLIVSPRSDVLIDARSHDDLVCDAPKARLQRAPGARHELLMETDELRAIFWQAFDAFITDLEAARAMRGPEPGPHAAGPAAS